MTKKFVSESNSNRKVKTAELANSPQKVFRKDLLTSSKMFSFVKSKQHSDFIWIFLLSEKQKKSTKKIDKLSTVSEIRTWAAHLH